MRSDVLLIPAAPVPMDRRRTAARAEAVHSAETASLPFERSVYEQPGICRTFGSAATLCLFALGLALMLWISLSPVARIATAAPQAVTLELAPVSSAPAAAPVDVPPGPVQQEQEASSEARPMTHPSPVEAFLPSAPSSQPRAAAAEATSERTSLDARAIERTTAPPAAAKPDAAVAAPATSAAAEQAARANWQSQLLGHLKGFLRYPRQAQSSRQEGITLVALTIDRQGKVLSARVERGSGYPTLDSEAVATARRGSPVPPPTADIRGDPVSVTIPIIFSLRR